jgi:hypothetical protein
MACGMAQPKVRSHRRRSQHPMELDDAEGNAKG